MNNILVRSLTGAVFITLVLFPLFWNSIAVTAVFGLFLILGLIEFFKLFKSNNITEPCWRIGLAIGFSIYAIIALIALGYLPILFSFFILPIIFLGMISELYRKKQNPIFNIGITTLSIIYLVAPFSIIQVFSVYDTHSFPLLVGMFLLIWMNDTFAFLSGKFFGKTKLFERISPKKTWEGTIGGVIFTLIAAVVISYLFDHNQKLIFWIISALIIAPCSILGDLLESLFKRNLNVKDSGNILPGHGGILDRFDATLMAVPFFTAWTYLYFYIL